MVLVVVFKLCGCNIAKNCNKCGQWNCNWGRGVPKSLNVEIVAVDCFLLTWFSTKLTFKLNICLKS